MKYIKLIKQTFIGCQLTDNEIKTALHHSNFRIIHFIRGEFLHLAGDDCFNLEILLIGNIVNMQLDQYGNKLKYTTFGID